MQARQIGGRGGSAEATFGDGQAVRVRHHGGQGQTDERFRRGRRLSAAQPDNAHRAATGRVWEPTRPMEDAQDRVRGCCHGTWPAIRPEEAAINSRVTHARLLGPSLVLAHWRRALKATATRRACQLLLASFRGSDSRKPRVLLPFHSPVVPLLVCGKAPSSPHTPTQQSGTAEPTQTLE